MNDRQMIEESACKPRGRLPLRHRMSMDTHRWQHNPFPIDFQGRIPVEAAVKWPPSGSRMGKV
jgi:hypothetical protein